MDAPGAGDAFKVHRQMVIALFVATLFLSVVLSVGLIVSRVTVLMVVASAVRISEGVPCQLFQGLEEGRSLF